MWSLPLGVVFGCGEAVGDGALCCLGGSVFGFDEFHYCGGGGALAESVVCDALSQGVTLGVGGFCHDVGVDGVHRYPGSGSGHGVGGRVGVVGGVFGGWMRWLRGGGVWGLDAIAARVSVSEVDVSGGSLVLCAVVSRVCGDVWGLVATAGCWSHSAGVVPHVLDLLSRLRARPRRSLRTRLV